MKILVIGGTGHIGSFLVPRLVREGHEVTVVARNPVSRYSSDDPAWAQVKWELVDRRATESDGTWRSRLEALEADVVVDLICYTVAQNQVMIEAFRGRIAHFLHCGSIWAYGPSRRVPYLEHYPRKPACQYGVEKAAIEEVLMNAHVREDFPATVIHPGHISSSRWKIIDPQGGYGNLRTYRRLARGETVFLPDLGLPALHHVHADDVARLFHAAICHREAAVGQSFSAVSPYGMTLRACCEFAAGWFGKEAKLAFVPLEQMKEKADDENTFKCIRDHVLNSVVASLEKAARLVGFRPRFTTEDIFVETLEEMLRKGEIER
ncbi:MAG: NAD-dependent epimerase/dehydratase family protein [Kiritimatiellia bacterium]